MSYQKCTSPASPCPNSDASSVRPLSVNLKDHCLICLGPEDPSIIRNILTANPLSLLNFQPLVYYLTGIDPTNKEEETKLLRNNKYFPMIANLPPMCSTCYQVLGEVYRLHNQLVDIQVRIQKQILVARKIVENTVKEDRPGGRLGASIRNQLFKKMGVGMRSLLSKEETTALRYFVENFHGLIIEAKNKFIFPSPPPPPDSQSKTQESPPLPPTALMTLSYPVVFALPSDSNESRMTSHYSRTSPNSPPSTPSPQQHSFPSSSIEHQDHRFPSPHITPSPPPSMPRTKLMTTTTVILNSSPSHQSSQDPGNTNSEMIVVSGIDHNLKYEVEYDEDDEMISEGEDEGSATANVMVIIKDDLEEQEQIENARHNDSENGDFDNHQVSDCEDESANNVVKLENPNSSEVVLPDEEYDHHYRFQQRSVLKGTPSSNTPTLVQVCDICNQTFNVSNLKLHIAKHLGKDGWSCDVCNRTYLSRSRLIHHFGGGGHLCRQKSSWYQMLNHSCGFCSSPFPTEGCLHQHIFSVHELDESLDKVHKCKICGGAYRTRTGLDFHFNVHLHKAHRMECWSGLEALLPPNCSPPQGVSRVRKKYRQSSSLDDYTCEICGKKCVGSTSLLRHVKEVHKGQRKKTPNVGEITPVKTQKMN